MFVDPQGLITAEYVHIMQLLWMHFWRGGELNYATRRSYSKKAHMIKRIERATRLRGTGSEESSWHETSKNPKYYNTKTCYIYLARLATQALAWFIRTMNTTSTSLSEPRAPGYVGPLHSTGREFAGVSCTVKTFLTCVFLGRCLSCRTASFLTTQSYHYLSWTEASSSTSHRPCFIICFQNLRGP